jgi:UDP-GlcNAc:undecaprenyl-phosphate GlcNAc-1-phosphate transferase
MVSYAVAFALALVVAAILTPLVRDLSLKLRAYDTPDERKVHSRVIPRTGGFAIVVAFLGPLAGIALTEAGVGMVFYREVGHVVGLTVGTLLIMVVGLLDDLVGLGARKKLLLQCAVATFAYATGFRIEAISFPIGGSLDMGVFGYFVTLLWIVGLVNAMNLIDGLDGLAAGIGFLALLFNFVLGFANNNVVICFVAASMAGAILGFLIYNFNPASVFMGDAGSMSIGYVLALGAIVSGQKSSTTVALLSPVVAMGVPIIDTLFSMVRRFLERRPMFSPDRGHLHHRLLARGLTHRRVVFTLYVVSIVLILAAITIHFGRSWQIGLGLASMVVALFVLGKAIGLAEYVAARRRHRMGLRSHHTELLRKTLYEALVRAEHVGTRQELEEFLHWFMERTEIRDVGICLAGGRGPALTLANEVYPVQSRKPLLEAPAPFGDGRGNETGVVKFAWQSERGRVAAETEILLQVVVDRLGKGLSRLVAESSGEASKREDERE